MLHACMRVNHQVGGPACTGGPVEGNGWGCQWYVLERRLNEIGPVHAAASLVGLGRGGGRHVFTARLLVSPGAASAAAGLQQTHGDGRMGRTGHRRWGAGPLRVPVVRHLQLDEFAVGGLFEAAQQVVVLQLEDVLLSVVVVQLDARFLGGQSRLGCLLLADERSARRRLGDADAGQAGLLQKKHSTSNRIRINT